jgi:hypothetical protein
MCDVTKDPQGFKNLEGQKITTPDIYRDEVQLCLGGYVVKIPRYVKQ